MARIRTIKPDFFRHERLYEAEREERLPLRVAFSGLWTAADREGRFRWAPRQLKLDCLPYDTVDFARVLDALWTRGFIEKYAVNGIEYGVIPSWQQHQVINNREKESDLPEPSVDNILTCEARVGHALATCLTRAQGEGKGKEGEGKGKDKPTREARRPDGPFEEFWKAYPKRDGANPKSPANKSFDRAVRSGADPGMIIAGAQRYALAESKSVGTQYIAQAVTWLNQRRWEDYANGHQVAGSAENIELVHFTLLDHEAKTGNWNSKRIAKSEIPPETVAKWKEQRIAS